MRLSHILVSPSLDSTCGVFGGFDPIRISSFRLMLGSPLSTWDFDALVDLTPVDGDSPSLALEIFMGGISNVGDSLQTFLHSSKVPVGEPSSGCDVATNGSLGVLGYANAESFPVKPCIYRCVVGRNKPLFLVYAFPLAELKLFPKSRWHQGIESA